MLFKWSSGGHDVRHMDLCIRSLHKFYPDATYVVCYNGNKENLDNFRQQIQHLPVDKLLVVWDYPWPFDFDVSPFWNKYVPVYLDEFGGHQFHIDNDILFCKKPSRFEFEGDMYITPEGVPTVYNCATMLPLMQEHQLVAVNSGVFGISESFANSFRQNFYKSANKLATNIDLKGGEAEQSHLAWFIQNFPTDIYWEDLNYIINIYEMQHQVNSLSDLDWVGIHFLAQSKERILDKFFRLFNSDWDDSRTNILQSILRTEDFGSGLFSNSSRRDRRIRDLFQET